MKQHKTMNTCWKKQLKYDLFQAYYDARRNKRNTINQLRFEIAYERNLLLLYEEILSRRYELQPSIAFIVNKPVKREIFAADFRDRVVHHLIFNYINPMLEMQFIDDTYSCRKGKGTHYGVKRVAEFMKNFTSSSSLKVKRNECFVLKLDIQGYFMSINKHILWEKLSNMLKPYEGDLGCLELKEVVWYLLEKVIWNDPRRNCIVKSPSSEWDDLPPSKSLFHAAPDCGLPIGNLTSQLFSNVYLHEFDCFVKNELGAAFYGRYVDDFVLIHRDKAFLLSAKEKIKNYLQENCRLTLHPKKIYLQHYTKGVAFLGAYIKPDRIYIGKRTKGNFLRAVRAFDGAGALHTTPLQIRATLNSYLGIMSHYQSYNIRRKALWGNENTKTIYRYGCFTNGFRKYELKPS